MRLLCVGLGVTLAACASGGGGSEGLPPTPPSVPAPQYEPEPPPTWRLSFTVMDQTAGPVPDALVTLDNDERMLEQRFTDAQGRVRFDVQQGQHDLAVTAIGYRPVAHALLVLDDAHVDVVLEGMPHSLRQGPVNLRGRALTDDGGPFPAIGASLFWAAWGYGHDRYRLEQNLDWLSRHGFDYIRVLAMVGTQPFWQDRVIDPRAPDYWETVQGLSDLAYDRYGLRLQWVLFADAQVMMPEPADRTDWVDRWAAFANDRPERIMYLETANEFWQNGLNTRELVDLTARLGSRTDVLVAASAPAGQDCPSWQAVYQGGQADLATIHFDRDDRQADGKWRPVWQPSQYRSCSGLPRAAANNEPIGPGSSVASDDDPLRLVSAAVATFLNQMGAYVFHSRAGIRGDLNLWEQPHAEEIANGFEALKAYLPGDLANWRALDHTDPAHPFSPSVSSQIWPEGAAGGVVRALAAVSGDAFVVMPIGIRGDVRLRARRGMSVDVLHPLTGALRSHVELETGAELRLTDDVPAVVITGRYRSPT